MVDPRTLGPDVVDRLGVLSVVLHAGKVLHNRDSGDHWRASDDRYDRREAGREVPDVASDGILGSREENADCIGKRDSHAGIV